jgi:cyanophycin synthetase
LNNINIKNLKQVSKEYKLELIISNNISTKLINLWFEDLLLDKSAVLLNKSIIEEISEKGLILIKTLFQISQIPVFYNGKILSIKKNDNKYIVKLRIGYIDLISSEYYIKVINFSFKYILWMAQNEPTLENKLSFYKICQEEIINFIEKNMTPGKSRIPVLKAAFNKNIPFKHLGNGIYQLGWGSKSRKMDRSTIDTDSAIGSTLSQNKIFTANLLKMAGLPAPSHGLANTKEEALVIALKLKYPIVVKPMDLDRGEGVTVDIYDVNKLYKAFEHAFNLSRVKKIIIEKQVQGVCHRLFIANNKLLYCVKRLAISIQADGINTISSLLDNANNEEAKKAPWIKKEFFPNDSLTIEALKKLEYTLDSIPSKDTWIELRDIESTKWGGRDVDVTDFVHPDNLDIALRASKLFELNVVGIDIITSDISKSWNETNAIINEVNFAPLLGGGEISRSYIPKFFDDFIEKDGRIPLEIYLGNTQEAVNIAKMKHQEYVNKGFSCYFTNHITTLDNNYKEVKFTTNGILNRVQALLLNNKVDALILLIQNDEFLHSYIPFDKISKMTIVSNEIKSSNSSGNINELEFRNLIHNLST